MDSKPKFYKSKLLNVNSSKMDDAIRADNSTEELNKTNSPKVQLTPFSSKRSPNKSTTKISNSNIMLNENTFGSQSPLQTGTEDQTSFGNLPVKYDINAVKQVYNVTKPPGLLMPRRGPNVGSKQNNFPIYPQYISNKTPRGKDNHSMLATQNRFYASRGSSEIGPNRKRPTELSNTGSTIAGTFYGTHSKTPTSNIPYANLIKQQRTEPGSKAIKDTKSTNSDGRVSPQMIDLEQ